MNLMLPGDFNSGYSGPNKEVVDKMNEEWAIKNRRKERKANCKANISIGLSFIAILVSGAVGIWQISISQHQQPQQSKKSESKYPLGAHCIKGSQIGVPKISSKGSAATLTKTTPCF